MNRARTGQSNNLSSRLGVAWRRLLGRGTASSAIADSDPRNRIATLELDLRERDGELARVREEYDRLRGQAERERTGARSAGFEALACRLAPLLSQLATMQALADADRPVRASDVLKMSSKIERVLSEAGLTRIGAVGEETAFDTRLHERMSGADLDEGDPVIVRFVGYRLGDATLVKAMVSRVGASSDSTEGRSIHGKAP